MSNNWSLCVFLACSPAACKRKQRKPIRRLTRNRTPSKNDKRIRLPANNTIFFVDISSRFGFVSSSSPIIVVRSRSGFVSSSSPFVDIFFRFGFVSSSPLIVGDFVAVSSRSGLLSSSSAIVTVSFRFSFVSSFSSIDVVSSCRRCPFSLVSASSSFKSCTETNRYDPLRTINML